MKMIFLVLIAIIASLQYRLWYGDGSVRQNEMYQQRLDRLTAEVAEKRQRNDALYADVLNLRKNGDAIEERARYELGMIKPDETFFQVIK